MPRGGKRYGKPGVNHPLRSDLNSGDQYGDVAAREERISAVPITSPSPPAQPQQAPQQPLVAPGPLDRPTERPMEPITSGLPTGPGPGPEALGMEPDAGGLEKLRPMLPVLELLASRPGVGKDARNLIRRLRGGLG